MKTRSWMPALRCAAAILATMIGSGCAGGIDESLNSPISNNDTYAVLGYLWSGAREAILRQREPSTDAFTLALSYGLLCPRGGSGTYHGTLSGTKTAGTGSGTLSVTGMLDACQFDDITIVRVVTAPNVTVTGTVAVAGDTWSTITLHMVASAVTINGVTCPGGVDVTIAGTSPSSQPTSTGTACGRTGAVPLP
jgi:hypothetical protein